MEIISRRGKRKLPTTVSEYFVALYCKRRKIQPHVRNCGGLKVWKSLSSAEKEIFREKFEKWQDQNDKNMFRVLENIEPFLKKKATINEANGESHMPGINTDYNENQSNPSEKTIDSISNADSELTKQENIDDDSHTSKTRDDYDDYQAAPMINLPEHIDENMSNAGSEVPNQYYAASVIDRDIDEPTVEQETSDKVTEPLPPPILKSRDLFEMIKCNGTRPELATVEWMSLTTREKSLYRNAAVKIKKEYLNKYEQYLESLSDQELYKIYIKTLEN